MSDYCPVCGTTDGECTPRAIDKDPADEAPYQQALTTIIELEDQIEKLLAEVNLYKGMNTDLGNQLRETFALLKKSRDLLEVVMDTQIHNEIQELIAEIDKFYPRA